MCHRPPIHKVGNTFKKHAAVSARDVVLIPRGSEWPMLFTKYSCPTGPNVLKCYLLQTVAHISDVCYSKIIIKWICMVLFVILQLHMIRNERSELLVF